MFSSYSREMHHLIKGLLQNDPEARLSTRDILSQSFVKRYPGDSMVGVSVPERYLDVIPACLAAHSRLSSHPCSLLTQQSRDFRRPPCSRRHDNHRTKPSSEHVTEKKTSATTGTPFTGQSG